MDDSQVVIEIDEIQIEPPGNSGEVEPSVDQFNRQKKRRRARELIQENKFREAITLLENLPQTSSQQLLLSECYLQVGKHDKTIECRNELKKLMTSQPRTRVEDVMRCVRHCVDSSLYIRALSLLQCASALYKIDSKPNDAVVGVRNCSSISNDVIKTMMKQKESPRLIEFEIKFLEEMIFDFRSITEANPGVRTDMEARMLCDIGLCYRAANRHQKATDLFKRGIKILKRQFGSNALKLQIYGHLLNNLAIIYKIHGKYGKALSSYEEALQCYEKALDWENHVLKEINIGETHNNLSILRCKTE